MSYIKELPHRIALAIACVLITPVIAVFILIIGFLVLFPFIDIKEIKNK